ncbi:MAG: hypothetical protein IJ739_01590 [Bacteroidaceae bacterium]|nr:hypothetical protein [Bacteroidaceae bacterium]
MKKKTYIIPVLKAHYLNMSNGIMLSLSRETSADNGKTMDTKEQGDWNIWSDEE